MFKIRVKVAITRTIEVSEKAYPKNSKFEDVLRIEKENFSELLGELINEEATKISTTLTIVDKNGLPAKEISWVD